jgi:vacuolar-type H+-ATPase subunit I/STV1
MKHIAKINVEFLKEARKWDDLSYEEQRSYLKRHPNSKRKITAKSTKSKSNTAEKNAKEIVDIINHDSDISIKVSDIPDDILAEAKNIPADKLEDFAIGEDIVQKTIAKKYKAERLSDTLTKLFNTY